MPHALRYANYPITYPLVDGRLLVRGADGLYCYDLRRQWHAHRGHVVCVRGQQIEGKIYTFEPLPPERVPAGGSVILYIGKALLQEYRGHVKTEPGAGKRT